MISPTAHCLSRILFGTWCSIMVGRDFNALDDQNNDGLVVIGSRWRSIWLWWHV
jgi:hypothetical protein